MLCVLKNMNAILRSCYCAS